MQDNDIHGPQMRRHLQAAEKQRQTKNGASNKTDPTAHIKLRLIFNAVPRQLPPVFDQNQPRDCNLSDGPLYFPQVEA
ncbi:MAG TPA: hypothetical protein VFR76_14775 [Verrucomicrobiae bacterium]|nr:hypothetical protein [Verrucomicrobiae bacterium]